MHDHPGLRASANDAVGHGYLVHGRQRTGPAHGRALTRGGAAHHPDPVAQGPPCAGCPPNIHVAQRNSRCGATDQEAVTGTGVRHGVEIVDEQFGPWLELHHDIRDPVDDDRRRTGRPALRESVCPGGEAQCAARSGRRCGSLDRT